MTNEIKFNQQFIFEAKVEASVANNGALFLVTHTPYGKFNIFEDNQRTNFYQAVHQMLMTGDTKIFYLRAKARRIMGNQYGEKAEFIRDKMTGEPLAEFIQAPDLVNLVELRKEVTIELSKLQASNERYASFIRYVLSKTINPQNQAFVETPGGVYGAYAFRGGLLAHTVRMLKRLEHEMYVGQNPLLQLPFTETVNYDLLKVCAFIHEIGKCQAFGLSFSGTPEKTIKGTLTHHFQLTSLEVNRLLETYNYHECSNGLKLSEEEKMVIMDVVNSCYYFEESMEMFKPKTKEAYIFNKLEQLDHKIADIEMAEYENQGKIGTITLVDGSDLITNALITQTVQSMNPSLAVSQNNAEVASPETGCPVQQASPNECVDNNAQQPVPQQPQMPVLAEQNISEIMVENNQSSVDNSYSEQEQSTPTDYPIDLEVEEVFESQSEGDYVKDVPAIFIPQQQWYEYASA